MSDITTIAKQYREIEAAAEEAKAELKECNDKWTEIETALLEAMVEEGVKSVKIPGVGHFSMVNKTFLSYTADKKEQVMQYLRDSENGDLIKEDIAKAAFAEFITPHFEQLKAKYEEDGLDLVDARKKALEFLTAKGLSEFTKKTISVRKA